MPKKPTPTPPDVRRDATPAEPALVERFRARLRSTSTPPRFRTDGTTQKLVHPVEDIDETTRGARIMAATGTLDPHAASHLLGQAAGASTTDTATAANSAAALLAGIAPRDELEGMLATQMVATHDMALTMVRRATTSQYVDHLRTYGVLAARLMQTFTQQVETLARLRGQTGTQTVTVKHVTVEAGGQAVVGAVRSAGGGDDSLR